MAPGTDAISALVPHRPPILRLQQIIAATPEFAETAGHEPMSGGLPWELGAIEGLAQTAAVLHGQHHPLLAEAPAGMLVGLRRFTFHRAPCPGAALRYRIELVRRLGPAVLVAGRASADGVVYAEGELKLWNPEPASPE